MTAPRRGRDPLAIETMTLRKPTALDKIIDKVGKPRGATPSFGLPKWRDLPLDTKIPMIKAPGNARDPTRQKLGKKLWVRSKRDEFDLKDPYNRRVEFTYDPLHDEHLARYFSRPRNTGRLLELGLVNRDLDVICTLKDYNDYRAFLCNVRADRVNRELKRQQDLQRERRILGFAEANAKRELDGLKKAERKRVGREEARAELELRRARKEQERRDAAEKEKARSESIKLAKEEERRARVLESRMTTERARRRRTAISEMQRDRVVKSVTEWARRESDLKKARREGSARRADQKRRALEEAWKRREEAEKSEIARKEAALRYAEEQRDKFVKSYTSKVDGRRAKFEKRVRNYRRFLDCYSGRKSPGPVGPRCCPEKENPNKV